MNQTTRIRVAALLTALFLGGITAGGLGMRALDNSTNASPDPVQHARTQVIHQTKVRTVHVKPKRRKVAAPPPATSASQPIVAQAPAVQQAPTRVQSRTSPTGGAGGGESEGGGGEHEGGDD